MPSRVVPYLGQCLATSCAAQSSHAQSHHVELSHAMPGNFALSCLAERRQVLPRRVLTDQVESRRETLAFDFLPIDSLRSAFYIEPAVEASADRSKASDSDELAAFI